MDNERIKEALPEKNEPIVRKKRTGGGKTAAGGRILLHILQHNIQSAIKPSAS